MPAPDDFGLNPVQTLAHVADGAPAPLHQPVWNRWREQLTETDARLEPVGEPDQSDETATHQVRSIGDVRLGCALCLPPSGTEARAALVTTHGYGGGDPLESSARRWTSMTSRGVAVLVVRVRGFPGSRLDTGDLTSGPLAPLGWVTHGFPATLNKAEDALGWSLPRAVADVACSAHALDRWLASRLGRDVPLYLHGESFGAGLAVMAAAQTPRDFVSFERLAIGLPTFGDWRWRNAEPRRMAFGSGAHLRMLLDAIEDGNAIDTLRLCDAAVHATRIQCPVLCKLALLDEVVPAPAAAAVYNALGTDPGLKWRFLVPEGHTEPSISCARRHVLFEQCVRGFLDPGREPRTAMVEWEPVLTSGDRAPAPAPAPVTGEQGALFGEDDSPTRDGVDRVLAAAYERHGRTLDDLPYTEEWAALYAEVRDPTGLLERETFHRLQNLRKRGGLARLGRATSSPPHIDASEEQRLADSVAAIAGSLGQRDQLPFTPEFDRLVLEFNERTGRELSPHDVWRLIAKLAK